MAGGGGGAWKVAYADFVTAMMAFFMVMWLVSQDQKIKESVAKYFVDPVGFSISGSSTRPKDASGMFESEFSGPVPGTKHRITGQGRGDMPTVDTPESETTLVADSILEDVTVTRRWVDEARKQLAAAKKLPDVVAGSVTQSAAAHKSLARELKQQIQTEAFGATDGVYQDLVSSSLNRVDFEELAAELIQLTKEPN